jgi:transcriptional regulator
MSNEKRQAQITALLFEKRGYEQRGLKDRAKAVDEALRALGHEAKAPIERAEKRPSPVERSEKRPASRGSKR